MRVINCHAHYHGPDEIEEKRALWDSFGYVKTCISLDDEGVLALAQRYPDFVVPFYRVRMDEDGPEAIARAKERGFVGLKFIAPNLPYSHASYFPLYEKAQALGMPALFHTGFLGFSPGRGARQENMRPVYLITLASFFPEFRMVGAHLGHEDAMHAVRAMKDCENVWFDMSGGTIRYYPASWFRWLFERVDRNQTGQTPYLDLELVGKLIFGSDNPDDTIEFYRSFMAALEIPEAVQQKVYYDNAVKWLGL
jgi:predicted TIM-barrel fold metal-dependent hydrolase